jgi:serine/threonine protein kinase
VSTLPVLPGYVVVGPLGRGHSVWLAEETTSGLRGRVAVRVGRPDTPDSHLLQEIMSLSRVRSPHVVAYRHCLRTTNGACAIITEYVAGKPLAMVLADQPGCRLPWRGSEMSAGGVIMGVLRGLAALHAAEPPIVHRRVTPSNILIVDGSAVITDLRLSALSGGLSSPFREMLTGAAGTGRYMSPELAEGAVGLGGLDARADVWAAGVVLHEALSGELLFPQASNLFIQGCAHVLICMSICTLSCVITCPLGILCICSCLIRSLYS